MRTHRPQATPVQKRPRVIIVTDGDHVAMRALRMAAKRTGCRLITRSAGNPTPLTGVGVVGEILKSPSDPVIVMLDDNGDESQAVGEQAIGILLQHPNVQVIAVLAVASNTYSVSGAAVDFSVDYLGRKVETAVDKDGIPINSYIVSGDTVDILRIVDPPLVVGIGDIGKMNGYDAPERGSPVSTSAIEWILMQSPTAFMAPKHKVHGEIRGGDPN